MIKDENKPIAMLTAYDTPTAKIAVKAGVDMILVGDSLGPNVLGYSSVHQVTLADMSHHTAAVRRGAPNTPIVADIPWSTMDSSSHALLAAQKLMECGASIIKIELEPGRETYVSYLVENGIPVCTHIGYTPQTPGLPVTLQGKELDRAKELIELAIFSEKAGAEMLLLELVPSQLAEHIGSLISIPTIGIGAGPHCSGQVQVWYDISGFSEKIYRHAELFNDAATPLSTALKGYVSAVHEKRFPTLNNTGTIKAELVEKLKERYPNEPKL